MGKTLNKDKVVEFINNRDNFADILTIVHCINSEDMLLEDVCFFDNTEEFFEIVFGDNVMEAVRAVSYGDYNYADDYVLINRLGNLDTYDEWKAMNMFIEYQDEIVDTIFESAVYETDDYMCELLEDCFE